MKEVIFAKSSSDPDSPYGVSFVLEDHKLFIDCPCPAGMRSQLCKHRVAFLMGDESMLADPEQRPLLLELQEIAKDTSLNDLLSQYLTQVSELERLKDSFKNTKRQLSRKMDKGVRVSKNTAEKYGEAF